jgi:hypothetical protein
VDVVEPVVKEPSSSGTNSSDGPKAAGFFTDVGGGDSSSSGAAAGGAQQGEPQWHQGSRVCRSEVTGPACSAAHGSLLVIMST